MEKKPIRRIVLSFSVDEREAPVDWEEKLDSYMQTANKFRDKYADYDIEVMVNHYS